MPGKDSTDAGNQIEAQHAEITQCTDGGSGVAKQAHNAVGETNEFSLIRSAPFIVCFENGCCAAIELPLRSCVCNTVTKCGNIPHTKIEALGSNGMQPVRSWIKRSTSSGKTIWS